MSAADHRGAEGVDASGVRSHDMVGEGGGARGTNKSTEGWGVRSDIDGVGPWRMGAKGEVLVEKVFNEMGGGVETAGGGESVGMTTADPLKVRRGDVVSLIDFGTRDVCYCWRARDGEFLGGLSARFKRLCLRRSQPIHGLL